MLNIIVASRDVWNGIDHLGPIKKIERYSELALTSNVDENLNFHVNRFFNSDIEEKWLFITYGHDYWNKTIRQTKVPNSTLNSMLIREMYIHIIVGRILERLHKDPKRITNLIVSTNEEQLKNLTKKILKAGNINNFLEGK